ncbi:MAG: hypothetical protein ABIA04_14285 [Pseudomonadota bacterium]
MNKNFLVFKGSGGLTHMCRSLSQALYLAKKNNLHLIIDSKCNKAFADLFNNYFFINDKRLSYSCNYDLIPSELVFSKITINELKDLSLKYSDRNYFLNNIKVSKNINKKDPISVFGGHIFLWQKYYINPNIKVLDSIKKSFEPKKIKEKYLSLHFRNTDIQNDISTFIEKIKINTKTHKIFNVYLASDDCFAFDQIQSRLQNINLIQYTKPGNFNKKNIHYNSSSKKQQTLNCLLDIFMIINSDFWIPSLNSGLSIWIKEMLDIKKNIFDIKTKAKVV